MNDRTLIKAALIVSIAGIIALFFIMEKIEVSPQLISKLDEMPEGEEVDITGLVLNVRGTDKITFIEIAEEKIEKTNVVLFKSKNVEIKEGDVIRVIGSLEEYNGKKEIIGNRVELK